jgi:hypothetical protein
MFHVVRYSIHRWLDCRTFTLTQTL